MYGDNRFERVSAAIEQIGPADHVCTLYEQRDEEVAIAVSYIRTGLDRGELCVCVVDDGGESILNALASAGVDVDAEMRKGRLEFFEKPLAQRVPQSWPCRFPDCRGDVLGAERRPEGARRVRGAT